MCILGALEKMRFQNQLISYFCHQLQPWCSPAWGRSEWDQLIWKLRGLPELTWDALWPNLREVLFLFEKLFHINSYQVIQTQCTEILWKRNNLTFLWDGAFRILFFRGHQLVSEESWSLQAPIQCILVCFLWSSLHVRFLSTNWCISQPSRMYLGLSIW